MLYLISDPFGIISFIGFTVFSGLDFPDLVSVIFNFGDTAMASDGFEGGLLVLLPLTPLVRGVVLDDLGVNFWTIGGGLLCELSGDSLIGWSLMSAVCASLILSIWHLSGLGSGFSHLLSLLIVSTPTFWGSISKSETNCWNSHVADGDNWKQVKHKESWY